MFFSLTHYVETGAVKKKKHTVWIILEKKGNTSITELVKPTV